MDENDPTHDTSRSKHIQSIEQCKTEIDPFSTGARTSLINNVPQLGNKNK